MVSWSRPLCLCTLRHSLTLLRLSTTNCAVNEFGASASAGCPLAFPFKIAPGFQNSQYGLCYKQPFFAKTGVGPCGSWCANAREWPVVKSLWGDKCGSLCPPLPPPPTSNKSGTTEGHGFPDAAWLLHRLLDYAASAPQANKSLVLKVTECQGCVPSRFVALCPVENGTTAVATSAGIQSVPG